MTLRVVLLFKITFTVVCWVLPLLFAPAIFPRMGAPEPGAMTVFLRLLAAAFTALALVYWFALRSLGQGRNVSQAVHVGAISNGLASAVLVYHGATGQLHGWGPWALAGMWGSAVVTGVVALALLGAARTGHARSGESNHPGRPA